MNSTYYSCPTNNINKMSCRNSILEIKERMAQNIIGQEELIERLILVLLSDGNLLLEGLPGLAKTRAIKSLSNVLDSGLSRIQFTPDLLPSDVTGTEILVNDGESSSFQFQKGPIFNNLILADEINRAPAKVQAALLEAMEERTVSVGNKTHLLPELFFVMATQNPVEQEGTYPLPEAQMDRFLMLVKVNYPSKEDEKQILKLVRGEEIASRTSAKSKQVEPKIDPRVIFEARDEIAQIEMSEGVIQYLVDIIDATRCPEKYDSDLAQYIEFGASPRATIAIDRASRSLAWLRGQDYVSPEEIKAIAKDCLRHRIGLSYEASASGITSDEIIEKILQVVAI